MTMHALLRHLHLEQSSYKTQQSPYKTQQSSYKTQDN